MCTLCDQVLYQPYQVLCTQGRIAMVHLVVPLDEVLTRLYCPDVDHVFCKQCLMNYIDEKGIIQSKNKTREPHHQDHDLFSSYSSSPITKIITMTCPQCEREQQPLELLDIATFRSAKFVEVCGHHVTCFVSMKYVLLMVSLVEDCQRSQDSVSHYSRKVVPVDRNYR